MTEPMAGLNTYRILGLNEGVVNSNDFGLAVLNAERCQTRRTIPDGSYSRVAEDLSKRRLVS